MKIPRSFLLLALLLVSTSGLAAQQARTITGRVISAESLAPIPGVSIAVEGGAGQVLSGPDGRYTIQAPANGRLVFDVLGHEQHREFVRNRSVIEVELQPAEVGLNEVVAVGYGANWTSSLPVDVRSYTASWGIPYRQGTGAPTDLVTYTISGLLENAPYQLPIEIVTALHGDTHLRGMELRSPGTRSNTSFHFSIVDPNGRPSFDAAFGFATLEEFHAWYAQRGAQLHRAIERTAAEDFRFNLSVTPAASPSTF